MTPNVASAGSYPPKVETKNYNWVAPSWFIYFCIYFYTFLYTFIIYIYMICTSNFKFFTILLITYLFIHLWFYKTTIENSVNIFNILYN